MDARFTQSHVGPAGHFFLCTRTAFAFPGARSDVFPKALRCAAAVLGAAVAAFDIVRVTGVAQANRRTCAPFAPLAALVATPGAYRAIGAA